MSEHRYWLEGEDDWDGFDGEEDGGWEDDEALDEPDGEPLAGEEDDEDYDTGDAAGGSPYAGGTSGDLSFAPEGFAPQSEEELFDAFPDARVDDFVADRGEWSARDYAESALHLFGAHEHFGETRAEELASRGYTLYSDPGLERSLEGLSPGLSDSLHLFERFGSLNAFGFVPLAVLGLLRQQYPGLDFGGLHVTVPDLGVRVPPRPLPAEFQRVAEKPAVDLRPWATPVADQKQTARCSAFAWTHAQELLQGMTRRDPTRLSVNYTMLNFQRQQGDAEDYQKAYEGGEGTVSGPEPGEVLQRQGTCRQELWPDDFPRPVVSERQLEADAQQRRLPATPWPIALEDVRRVLSAGLPVHVSMNTGPHFADLGRDGVVRAAETASGRHGRHAMLMVGYTGNFFIVKNSWGPEWGDRGYCYVPARVLADSDADFVAVLAR